MDRPENRKALEQHIESIPVEGAVADMRAAFSRRAGPQPDCGIWLDLGGYPALTIGEGPALIWFHGGGYVMGEPDTHRMLGRHLADQGLQVILPQYPKAPEAEWPAPLEAALKIARAMGGPVALGGDSAGGHLALLTALECLDCVSSVSLVSPNTDRTGQSLTRARSSDLMNDDTSDRQMWDRIAPNLRDDSVHASPHMADLSELPPLHIEAAGDEILLDDSLILARKAAAQGVQVSLHVTQGLFHMHTLWPDILPEGASALDRIAANALASA